MSVWLEHKSMDDSSGQQKTRALIKNDKHYFLTASKESDRKKNKRNGMLTEGSEIYLFIRRLYGV